MKKKLVSILAVAACLMLVCGCGDSAKGDNSVSGNDVSQSDVSENGLMNMEIDASQYVTLGEYKGVEVSVPGKIEYEESAYELRAKTIYFAYIAETEGVTDRPVKLYDMTNIDYVGKKDGVAFEGGTAQGYSLLIGSGQFIDGFEDGLVGVMPGETVDLNLKFPDAYGNADLAGQEVVFTVTVNYIPEMKDEKIPEFGIPGVSTVSEYVQYVKDAMIDEVETEYRTTVGEAVMQQLVAGAQFAEIPEEFLAQNKVNYVNYLTQMAASYGMDAENFVAMNGGDYDAVVEEGTQMYAKQSLIILAIAQKEGLIPDEAALDARMEEYAGKAGVTVDDLLSNGLTKDVYKESFVYEDVLKFLVENAVNNLE